MLLLEGLATIAFGLWVMSQGTEPGASILIILGLPVLLFGIVQTFIGFARLLKEKAPDALEPGLEQSAKKRDRSPTIDQSLSFASSVDRESPSRQQKVRVRPEQKVREQQARRNRCPECGAKYGIIDLVTQPTMCSECWKKS
jgi:hypothetical protein